MAAGESAREIAKQRREKSERLARQAEMFERGAIGEELTASVLESLTAQSWVHVSDIRWPGRQRANIDHVAVGPAGVFVIDSKNWTGQIRVTKGVLRQNGCRRDPTVVSCATAATAVRDLVPSFAREHVQPVLCFAGDHRLAGRLYDVEICSTTGLAEMLAKRRQVLNPEQVAAIAAELESNLPTAVGPGRAGRGAVTVPSKPGSPRRRPRGSRLLRLLVLAGVALLLLAYGGQLFLAFGNLVDVLVERVLSDAE